MFVLDDGTGKLLLAFTGSRAVPGMDIGARCTIEGTVLADEGELVVWNPLYRFDPKGSSESS